MMSFLSRLLPGGSLMTIPLVLAVIMAVHHLRQERDARIELAGRQQCNQIWEVTLARRERDAALAEVVRQRKFAEIERTGAQELSNELERIRVRHEKELAAADSDPRCLSDGVLDALRKHGGLR